MLPRWKILADHPTGVVTPSVGPLICCTSMCITVLRNWWPKTGPRALSLLGFWRFDTLVCLLWSSASDSGTAEFDRLHVFAADAAASDNWWRCALEVCPFGRSVSRTTYVAESRLSWQATAHPRHLLPLLVCKIASLFTHNIPRYRMPRWDWSLLVTIAFRSPAQLTATIATCVSMVYQRHQKLSHLLLSNGYIKVILYEFSIIDFIDRFLFFIFRFL